jgi:YggT family protein
MGPRYIVLMIAELITLLIFVRIIMSWLPMAGIRIDPYNPVVRYLHQFTDIFLEPFRRVIPPVSGFDFSPIIALLVIRVIGQIVAGLMPF